MGGRGIEGARREMAEGSFVRLEDLLEEIKD